MALLPSQHRRGGESPPPSATKWAADGARVSSGGAPRGPPMRRSRNVSYPPVRDVRGNRRQVLSVRQVATHCGRSLQALERQESTFCGRSRPQPWRLQSGGDRGRSRRPRSLGDQAIRKTPPFIYGRRSMTLRKKVERYAARAAAFREAEAREAAECEGRSTKVLE